MRPSRVLHLRRLAASCIYPEATAQGYVQCLPRAMLGLREKKLATRARRAHSDCLHPHIPGLWWSRVRDAISPPECERARELSRSDGDEHEHGPFGLRRGFIVGVDQD